ncbi:MAG TPA: DcaP family trimeric outer membrane transporter, partial [Fimbriimonadaceae bacterium]|nr:DcaP family trimeric outer membrane transporter [Fimbriimonadaceae bacterium]
DVHDSKMKDHLLGHLVLERSAVAMSRGRDLVLEPAQKAPPLNNFIYPYAEADGSPVDAQWTLNYQRLGTAGNADVQSQIDGLRATVEEQQRQIAQLLAKDGRTTLTATTAPVVTRSPKSADGQVTAKSKDKVSVYGFLRTDAIYNTQDQSPNIQFPFYVRSPDDTGGDTDRFTLHPRLTRLGLDFTAPEGSVPGWKSTGKIEIDFQGGGSESRPNPRARHLYLQLERNGQSWLFGQTSDLISPLFPSPNDDSIMWNAGNPGDRRPQIRYTSAGDTQFAVALGLTGAIDGQDLDADGVRDGEDSGVPNVQARVGFKSGGSTFGVWGHVASEQTNTPIAGSTHFQSDSLGVDWHVPLAGGVSLSGEAWTGQDLSDFRGGIGQGVNTTTGNEIRSSGGWAEVGFQASPMHHVAFGYTLDDPVNADLGAGGRSRNWTAYLANKWSLGDSVEVGFNYIYWNTDFIGKSSGHDNRFNFYIKRKF